MGVGWGTSLVRSEGPQLAHLVSHGGVKSFRFDLCSGEHWRGSSLADMIGLVFWKDPGGCCVEGRWMG